MSKKQEVSDNSGIKIYILQLSSIFPEDCPDVKVVFFKSFLPWLFANLQSKYANKYIEPNLLSQQKKICKFNRSEDIFKENIGGFNH